MGLFQEEKMIKKLLALLLVLILSVSLIACNDGEEETTDDGKINITEDTSDENDETGDEIETGSANEEIGDPGEYSYSECDQTVYVNNPGSAVTLRTADYEAKGSVAHGTELRRIGLSTDSANYWSKVIYEEQEYYIASKFLTTLKNADEGFVDVEKTVVVNEQTGSLNIRNLPTFEGSAVIGWAEAGVEIKVVAENATTGWYKIEFVPYGSEESTFGYIKSGADNFVQDEDATNAETGTEKAETETAGASAGK